MKKNIVLKTVASAILLVSGAAMAGADYPAADFQPKVVFSDPSAAAQTSSAKSAAAPAAKAAEAVVEHDPNFPAANFQPKVVYADSNYKHDASAPGVERKSTASGAIESSEAAVVSNHAVGSESSSSTFIGVALLAAVGLFFMFNKKQGPSTSSAADDYVASGATGVEKYLDKLGSNKTGVAKYLEKQVPSNTTGVAKYMAKQIVKDREAAAARATGVEKYLRDKV